MQKNIIPHQFSVSKIDREKRNGHKGCVLWFTGLSGSGKSTIANAVAKQLFDQGFQTYSLDGDNVRQGLNNNLSFSPQDRTENIRRIAEVAHLMVDAGLIVTASFVSPYEKDRNTAKKIIGNTTFVEVFVSTPIEVCEQRDVKGLYAKARAGEIVDFTGVNAPYQAPKNPHIEVNTATMSLDQAVKHIVNYYKEHHLQNE